MSARFRLTYRPEGGSQRSWVIDVENPAWDITFGTEKATGWAWAEFCERMGKMSVIAIRALLWVLRKRDEPKLDIEAVTVSFDEIDLDEIEEEQAVEDDGDPKASTS